MRACVCARASARMRVCVCVMRGVCGASCGACVVVRVHEKHHRTPLQP